MSSLLYFIIILLTAIIGYLLRFLTVSGSIAACVVGILTLLGVHSKGLFLLGVFFATSSFWSHYKRLQKNEVEERLAKGSQRDWLQVVANGGGASIASVLYFFYPDPLWLFLFCVCIASSNSDTWASEIGTLSTKSPISIRTFSIAQKGTSGAISLLGTIAGATGALLIAALSFFLFHFSYLLAFLVFIFGFLGNIVDTVFGAFFQATYKCRICHLETEKTVHCGSEAERIRGFAFLNNDMVNLFSSVQAALMGAIAFLWLI